MELIKLFNISLIIIAPFLIFLSAIHLIGFSNLFYKEEFSKYDVEKSVPETLELHQNVMDFLKGKNAYLPDKFNDGEKQHFHDVRRLVLLSKAILYLIIASAGLLIILSARKLKKKIDFGQFIGKALLFGGLLAITIAALLFLLINLNFSSSFESFHKIFFQPDTYAFDPAYEIIVNLYPEELFMDLGLRIAEIVVIISSMLILFGGLLILKSKKQK